MEEINEKIGKMEEIEDLDPFRNQEELNKMEEKHNENKEEYSENDNEIEEKDNPNQFKELKTENRNILLSERNMTIFKKIMVTSLILIVISFGLFALTSKFFQGDLDLPIGAQMNEDVKTAYLFAKDNTELLKQIPCNCGCSEIGHKNNYDCYLNEEGEFIEHGSMCGGCMGTTLDVKKLKEKGKSVEEIKEYIIEKYPPTT